MDLLIIREFKENEWSLYKKLRLESLMDSPDAFGSTYENEIKKNDLEWRNCLIESITSKMSFPLIAEYNNKPAGLAWFNIEEENYEKSVLYQMWINPKFRNRGIGFKMLKEYKDWSIKLGAKYLYLNVTTTNSSASHLYSSFGFVFIGSPSIFKHGDNLEIQSMILELD